MRKIIITSNEPWGEVWYSKQHYANELAKIGFEVFFLDPVQAWRFGDLISFSVTRKIVSKNLYVLTYKNNLPVRIFHRLFLRINDRLNSYKLSKIVDRTDTLWWKFDPFRFIHIGRFSGCPTIYHVVDPYSHFWQDIAQAGNSDLIVCTNEKYANSYRTFGFSPLLVPHGISTDEFAGETDDEVQRIKSDLGEFAIIAGAIGDDWDFELLKSIADEGVKILVLGKETESVGWYDLKAHSNVVYRGVVHAKSIKYYINAAKVCLVPYAPVSGNVVRSPLKFLNYLAQFKPIVTSFDPMLKIPANKAIFFADSNEEFVELTRKAIEGKLEVDRTLVSKYLRKHQYPGLIERILRSL